ncbi:MAG: DoxX family membrane protein [Chloroflexi bacterium]|nr:DoxX family membrane protein [Chloroflexota bacterium]
MDETEQNRRHLESALLLGARVLVGGIFLIAGVAKVGSPGAFAEAIRAFHILPGDLVMPFARIVPWLELLVAAYLLAGFLTRVGALGSCLLLGSFVYALADSLATGNTNHACGCFGSGAGATPILAFLAGGDTVTWWDVIRDLILIALSLLVLVRGAGALSLDGWLARRRDLAEEA